MSWVHISSENKGPEGRWGHTSVALDEKIYVFGGYDGNYLNDFYCYDFDQRKWQTLSSLGQTPEPRSNHVMLTNNGNIFIQGGGGVGKNRYGDLYQYSERTWTKVPVTLISRTYHAGCVGQNKLFIYGGESGLDLDQLEVVDLNTLELIKFCSEGQEKPEARRFATISCVENQLIVIGGCSQSYIPSSSIYVANLREEKNQLIVSWSKLSNTFTKWGHSSLVFDDLIYIFGGRDSKDSNELFKFDLFNRRITQVDSMSKITPRRKHSSSIIGNSLVIFGGFNGSYQSDFCFFELPLINQVPLSVELPIKPYQEISQFEFENQFLIYDGIQFLDELYDCLVQTATVCYGVSKQKMINISGYFQALFRGDYAEGELSQINLNFVESVAFGIVLLYSQKKKLILPILNKEELFNILELCDYLDMVELKDKIEYYIAQTVDKNTLEAIYKLSVEHQNNQLQTFCAYRVSQFKMPLQEIDNIQCQQVNRMKKIRKLSLMNEQ